MNLYSIFSSSFLFFNKKIQKNIYSNLSDYITTTTSTNLIPFMNEKEKNRRRKKKILLHIGVMQNHHDIMEKNIFYRASEGESEKEREMMVKLNHILMYT